MADGGGPAALPPELATAVDELEAQGGDPGPGGLSGASPRNIGMDDGGAPGGPGGGGGGGGAGGKRGKTPTEAMSLQEQAILANIQVRCVVALRA